MSLMRYKMAPNVGSAVKRNAPDPLQLFMHTNFSGTGGVPNHCRTALQQIEIFSQEKKVDNN